MVGFVLATSSIAGWRAAAAAAAAAAATAAGGLLEKKIYGFGVKFQGSF